MAKEDEKALHPDEEEIMKDLEALHRAYIRLVPQHPTERQEFLDGVHRLSGLMALRAARLCFPLYWPTYFQDAKGKWIKQ